MAGGEYLGFSNATFLSEREAADRNFSIAYYMKEHKCFPKNAILKDVMDFYFQVMFAATPDQMKSARSTFNLISRMQSSFLSLPLREARRCVPWK